MAKNNIYKKAAIIYAKQPEIISAEHGEITTVRRHIDNVEISIGTPTNSGGNVTGIKIDTRFTGNMYAELSECTAHIAISCLVILEKVA